MAVPHAASGAGNRENARSALECGGLTPPCSFEIHTDPRAKQGRSASQEPGINLGKKAASSRRTPRCLRTVIFKAAVGRLAPGEAKNLRSLLS